MQSRQFFLKGKGIMRVLKEVLGNNCAQHSPKKRKPFPSKKGGKPPLLSVQSLASPVPLTALRQLSKTWSTGYTAGSKKH